MRLIAGVVKFLSFCAVILLLQGVATAQLPIDVRSVYTTDENFNPKTVFAPGDTINYHVDVDNTTGSTFPVDIRFQVFTAFSLDPTFYGYDQIHHVDQMPVGLSRFYSQTIIPSDARIYSGYILRIIVTESPCCSEDYGVGEFFSIQTTEVPKGEAPNLIVLVHGCCTDANGVGEWNALAEEIKTRINTTEWEVVVWDWHEYTPKHQEYISCFPGCLKQDADVAYLAADNQGFILAEAIKIHEYKHLHLIGHSAGAKLIHEAARAYIGPSYMRQVNAFIHLTFLDAYAPIDSDNNGPASYGSLPADYPNHYSEHYVDKTTGGFSLTDADLMYARNFDITDWVGADKGDLHGHQWPRYWYEESITAAFIGCGFGLSLEGGNNEIAQLAGVSGSLKLGVSDCIGDVPPPPIPTPRPTPPRQ